MIPFVIVFIIVITIGPMVFFFFQGNPRAAEAVLLLGSGVLNLAAFFLLTWVRPNISLEFLQKIGHSRIDIDIITGWSLITKKLELLSSLKPIEIPLGDDIRILLGFLLGVALLAIITGLLHIAEFPRMKIIGLSLTGVSLIMVVLLSLSLKRIIYLDSAPEDLGGIRLDAGMGIWLTFVGLVGNIIGGILLWSDNHSNHKGKKRSSSSDRPRPGSMGRPNRNTVRRKVRS